MNLQKLFSWLLALVLVLTIVGGCKASGQTAIELVPPSANLIAEIQVSKIINDQDFRDAYDEAQKEPGQPQTFEEALDEIVEEIGIDFRDFSKAVVFADILTIEQAGYLGIIAEGTFDQERFVSNIEEKSGEEFTTSDYKGYKLYIDQSDEFCFSFLSNKTLLLGTIRAVKDTIDVSKGDRQPVGGEIINTYNRLGNALIKAAFELPEQLRREITKEPAPGDIPISLAPFANMDTVGLALNKEADTIAIQIEAHFLSADSAKDAEDVLSGAISLFRGTIQIPEIKELLDKVEVTVAGSWMTIAFETTLSEIEQLQEVFQQ